jgi:hypothetical protein
MNKCLFSILLIFLSIIQSFCEPKMIDVKRYMLAAGEEDGIFQGTQDIAKDDLENFFALAFYSENAWYGTTKNGQKILDEELPLNKEGGLRLLAFIKFRIVEKPSREKENLNTIKLIKETFKSRYETVYWYKEYLKTNPPLAWSDKEIDDYYSEAIMNKIGSMSTTGLTIDEANKTRTLLHEYCIKPEKNNISALKSYTQQIAAKSLRKTFAIMSMVKELSADIFDLIYEENR